MRKERPYYGRPVPSKPSKMQCPGCGRMCRESALNNGGYVNGQWVCVRCRRVAEKRR